MKSLMPRAAGIRADGERLSLPLIHFDVSLVMGEPAALLSVLTNRQEASRWSLQARMSGPGYVAALVAECHAWRPVYLRWPESGAQALSRPPYGRFYQAIMHEELWSFSALLVLLANSATRPSGVSA